MGKLWTAIGKDNKPLKGYKQLFAFNYADGLKRFRREYGHDSSIVYLVGDTFSQWGY